MMKLQNGSDVRGIAVEGVPDEKGQFDARSRQPHRRRAMLSFLAQKLGKKEGDLRIAVGHDSRISADMMKEAVFAGLLGRGVHVTDCAWLQRRPCSCPSFLKTRPWTGPS